MSPPSPPTPKRALIVRPYAAQIRSRVSALLVARGYDMPGARVVRAGTPDDKAAAFLDENTDVDVWLIPFHAHKLSDGRASDGMGPLLMLSTGFGIPPVLMPVSAYSLAASFPRRFDVLRHDRPTLAKNVHAIRENHMEDDIRDALERITDTSSGPPGV